MTRVKRGTISRKWHKKILQLAKGFRGGLSKLYRPAHQAVLHALSNAYKDRRRKKRDFRVLWIARLNAAVRAHSISYSRFIGLTKAKNIQLNRKILSELAISNPSTFSDVVAFVKQ